MLIGQCTLSQSWARLLMWQLIRWWSMTCSTRRVWHNVLYQRVECEKESLVEKGALATGMTTVVVRSSRKDHSWTCESFTKTQACVITSSVIIQKHLQKRNYNCCIPNIKPALTRGNISSVLPGLGEQELSFCYEGGSQIKVIFASYFEMKIISLDEEWKDTDLKMLEVQCAVSAASNDSEWHAICFCKVVSKVNKSVYQEIMECFMLACVDKLYGGADFLFPKHMSTVPKLLLNGLMTILLLWVRNIWKPHLSV